jgi:hypothetical protein
LCSGGAFFHEKTALLSLSLSFFFSPRTKHGGRWSAADMSPHVGAHKASFLLKSPRPAQTSSRPRASPRARP